jgi:hypothetical protein
MTKIEINMNDADGRKAILLQELVADLAMLSKAYPGYSGRLDLLASEANEEILHLVARSL